MARHPQSPGPREGLAGKLRETARRFRRSELGGLAGDTGYVAVVQGSVVGAGLVQLALMTHALGLAEYGRFALAVSLATLVGAFFNLRVDIGATTYSARHMRTDPRCVVGVFQVSYLIDLVSGLVFIVVISLLMVVLDPSILGDVSPEVVLVYALALLGRNVEAVPIVVLRQLDRFKLIAGATFATEMTRLGMVFVALTVWESLVAVAAAIAIGNLGGAVIKLGMAARLFARAFPGERLTRPAVGHIPPADLRALKRTAFHTNLLSYENIAQVHVPTLMLGALAGATETGLYKVGMAIAALIGFVATPVSGALLPRLSRLWSDERFGDLRRLLKQATYITLPVVAILYGLVVVFRDPILELIGGGPEARAAGTVLILGAAGQAVYAAVFWRANVLHAAHRTAAVAGVSIAGVVLQLGVVLVLVPRYGAEGAAAAFLLSRCVINGILAVLALRTLARAGAPQA